MHNIRKQLPSQKVLALTHIKETFSSFVKLWNIPVHFLMIFMSLGYSIHEKI